VSRQLVESLLLTAIQQDLFNEEGYAIVKQEVARLLAERRRSRTPDLAKAKARLAQVEQEIANVLAFVKAGRWSDTTKSELVQLDTVTDFLPDTIGRFKAALADLTTVTQHQVDKARGSCGS
jgi:hypothetical protein